MTQGEAKQVFASMMQIACKRELTTLEKLNLTEARQVLRRAKRPAMNSRVFNIPSPRELKAISVSSTYNRGEMAAAFKNLDRAKIGRDVLTEKGFELDQIREHTKVPGQYVIVFRIPGSKRNPARKPVRSSTPTRRRTNPPTRSGVKIYGRILRIEAQKTQAHICDAACKKANHCYYHDFTTRNASIFGMPDGSLVVR